MIFELIRIPHISLKRLICLTNFVVKIHCGALGLAMYTLMVKTAMKPSESVLQISYVTSVVFVPTKFFNSHDLLIKFPRNF